MKKFKDSGLFEQRKMNSYLISQRKQKSKRQNDMSTVQNNSCRSNA
uniref:Uncharacterized protein n=1 Tax=Arundo donax TaxID=35708 RepID=A0A0A9AG34_ARUDO